MQLERVPKFPIATHKKPHFLPELEKYHNFPASIRDMYQFPCSDSRGILSSPSQLGMSPKTLIKKAEDSQEEFTPPQRRVLYRNQRGSLIPQLSRRPALPQRASSFLHFASRKGAPSHYDLKGDTHLPIGEEHSTAS